MKAKAYFYEIGDLEVTNKDVQVAICDLIFDAIDCAKPDVTVGFGPAFADDTDVAFILQGDPSSVKRGVDAVIGAIEGTIYPFDKCSGNLRIGMKFTKEET